MDEMIFANCGFTFEELINIFLALGERLDKLYGYAIELDLESDEGTSPLAMDKWTASRFKNCGELYVDLQVMVLDMWGGRE